MMIIWTLSLWDLKQDDSFEKNSNISRFELCPYGIWNLILTRLIRLVIYLNFVPMGFESNSPFLYISTHVKFELCPYGIWNHSPI